MSTELLRLYEAERARMLSLDGEGDYQNPVFGEGPLGARLMLVGEAPGAEEAKRSRAFVGKAGETLSRLLDSVQLSRDEVFITNAVKFRPVTRKIKTVSNRTPKPDELLLSLPLLKQELLIVRPRVVATLGNTPLKALLRIAGQKSAVIGDVHGKSIETEAESFSFVLFPLYHPASVIYNRALTQTLAEDFMKLNVLIKER